MTEWFYHVTCFANVSLLLLKSCNIKVINNIQIYHEEVSTHQVRFYYSCLVEIIVESVNLVQMSQQKIFITMMENNQLLIKKYISKHRAKSFILQETIVARNTQSGNLCGYCLCYPKTFWLVLDSTECTKIFFTEECSILFVPPKIK